MSLPSEIPIKEQKKYIDSLAHVLRWSGFKIETQDDTIFVSKKNSRKKLCVYPAIRREPYEPNTVFVSDAYIKYAKPYAIEKILEKI